MEIPTYGQKQKRTTIIKPRAKKRVCREEGKGKKRQGKQDEVKRKNTDRDNKILCEFKGDQEKYCCRR